VDSGMNEEKKKQTSNITIAPRSGKTQNQRHHTQTTLRMGMETSEISSAREKREEGSQACRSKSKQGSDRLRKRFMPKKTTRRIELPKSRSFKSTQRGAVLNCNNPETCTFVRQKRGAKSLIGGEGTSHRKF
jgi:hypothetical protein